MAIRPKTERLPNFLQKDGYLREIYNSKDLELTYVYKQCKTLKVLKGVEVTDDQIEFWFKEFLSKGWTKYYFDKRLEAVKMAKIYGPFIDINVWYDSEVLYSEFEVNVMIEEKIQRKIQEAKLMRQADIKLTPEQESFCRYEAANLFIKGIERERLCKMDELIAQHEAELKRQLKIKKVAIMNLSQAARMKLLNQCIDQDKIKCDKTGFEYSATVSALEYYADKIPDELLEEFLNQN